MLVPPLGALPLSSQLMVDPQSGLIASSFPGTQPLVCFQFTRPTLTAQLPSFARLDQGAQPTPFGSFSPGFPFNVSGTPASPFISSTESIQL